MYLLVTARKGISSLQLGKEIGITQKSAWFMLHRIRAAMRTGTFRKLAGEVESDETFVGGRAENMHAEKRARKIQGRGAVGKAIVHGLLERGSKSQDKPSQVIASVVPNTEAETLWPVIRANVEADTLVYTDASQSYANLIIRYVHSSVDHGREYVRGRVHTNGLENFWALLKRAIRGSYVAVAAFHLSRYVDEEAWRFNWRKLTDGERFAVVMKEVLGKRLTYRDLCAIDGAGFMGLT